MLARYVQVSPDELSELLVDPSTLADLVDAADDLPADSVTLTAPMRERFEQHAPQLLEHTLSGLDPSTREAVERRLEELGGGRDGSALLALMARRGLLETDEHERAGTDENGGRRTLSLDKAWHGIHFLLSGRAEPEPGPQGLAILGGTEIGEDDFGYGPARYLDPDEVAEVATEIGRSGLEQELVGRFDPTRMSALAIYPGGWQEDDGAWLLDGFRELQGFFADAAGRGAAIVTCLV